MEKKRGFLHDRLVLALVTLVALFLTIGVLSILIRFDISKNPTTIISHSNVYGDKAGKPIDIYSLAFFMVIIAAAGVIIGQKIYGLRRSMSIFLLSSTNFLLLLAIRVSWSIINKQ